MTWIRRRNRKEDSSLLKHRVLTVRAVPAVIATAAYLTSFAGNFFCNNIQLVPQGEFDTTDPYHPRTLSFGIWKHAKLRVFKDFDSGGVTFAEYCVGYPDDTDFNAAWTMARAFSCLTMIFAGMLLLWQWLAAILLLDARYWRWTMVPFAVIGGCQTMSLLFLYSNACHDNPMLPDMVHDPEVYPNECTWNSGTRMQIAAAVLYFCTSASLYLIPAPGILPKDREFPTMVWDHDSKAEDVDEDDDDDNSPHVFSDWHDDDDDDDSSTESFACDYIDDYLETNLPSKIEDLTETEVSQTGYFDDEVDLTIQDMAKPQRLCTV